MNLYQVECFVCGYWSPMQVWRVNPTDFSRFLDHLYRVFNASGCASGCAEEKNMIRVKRVNSLATAEFEFVGHGHINL